MSPGADKRESNLCESVKSQQCPGQIQKWNGNISAICFLVAFVWTDWHLRAVLTSALLCHRLWAYSMCCLCCFFLLWQVASCNGNAQGRGKRDSLGYALVTGARKDIGKVRACSCPRCGDAVNGTAESNSIFIHVWGTEQVRKR